MSESIQAFPAVQTTTSHQTRQQQTPVLLATTRKKKELQRSGERTASDGTRSKLAPSLTAMTANEAIRRPCSRSIWNKVPFSVIDKLALGHCRHRAARTTTSGSTFTRRPDCRPLLCVHLLGTSRMHGRDRELVFFVASLLPRYLQRALVDRPRSE